MRDLKYKRRVLFALAHKKTDFAQWGQELLNFNYVCLIVPVFRVTNGRSVFSVFGNMSANIWPTAQTYAKSRNGTTSDSFCLVA